MTPFQHKQYVEQQVREWYIPLSKRITLEEGLDSMREFKLEASDVPLVIKLVENPKYDIGLFAGNVSLYNHDCIHLLLGRGLQVKDEAFVIGFTMGSTQKMWRWRRNLYMFCAKYLFPEGYDFGEDERFVFNLGVKAGSLCETDLSNFNFKEHEKKTLTEIRQIIKLNENLLKSCYEVEKNCFPNSEESQRLL